MLTRNSEKAIDHADKQYLKDPLETAVYYKC